MKLLALAVSVAVIFPLSAEAAKGWGLIDEEAVRFEATVVDIRCELTGDCPAACGGCLRCRSSRYQGHQQHL